jgi:hypothetical protein
VSVLEQNFEKGTFLMTVQTKMTFVELLLGLRQRLLTAKDQNDSKSLVALQNASYVLFDIVAEFGDVAVAAILEDMVDSISDFLINEDWKSSVPTIEDILSTTK